MVYFEIYAGLGNRLQGMVSAYEFAKELGEPLTIIWEIDNYCNLRFDDYFNLKTDIPSRVITLDCTGSGFNKKVEHQANKLRKKYMQSKCSVKKCLVPEKEDIDQLKKYAREKSVYMKSCMSWYENGFNDEDYNIVELKPEMEEKILKLLERKKEKIVGVHIRRTDHKVAIENSPTELFIEAMRREDPNTLFYVASDEHNEIEKLIAELGKDRIIYNENAELKRGTIKGMEDAILDMYALSKTEKILASYNSSFSAVASKIGRVPLDVMNNIGIYN